MPSAPEFTHIAREIRHLEVRRQPDAEQLGTTDSDIAITRKIGINLEREQQRAHQQHQAGRMLQTVPCLVYHLGTSVGDNQFLDKAPKHLPQAVNSLAIIKTPLLKHLGQQVGCTLDGTRHQLREKTDEREEGHHIACRLNPAGIYVNRIAQSLEGIEADTHRQDDVERWPIKGNAQRRE